MALSLAHPDRLGSISGGSFAWECSFRFSVPAPVAPSRLLSPLSPIALLIQPLQPDPFPFPSRLHRPFPGLLVPLARHRPSHILKSAWLVPRCLSSMTPCPAGL